MSKKRNKEITLEGVFIANKKGFGFVEVEGGEEDFFIPKKYASGAFHMDRVLIEETKSRGKRREAKIIKVISHEIQEVVGSFEALSGFGFVVSDDPKISKDIFVPAGKDKNAVYGDKVVCRITDFGDASRKPEGEIVEILGGEEDPFVDIMSICRSFGMDKSFPDDVKAEAISADTEVTHYKRRKRLDLRDELIISIDGDDSKDLDDAISLEALSDGYRLGVHIADVSHYVKEKTALDREAFKRGTSVYPPGMVIPMLPEELSNGICSLNEGVDRLTLSCIMDIDKKGVVRDSVIRETVINNKHRMTYNGVNRILKNPECPLAKKNKDVIPMLFLMQELFEILNKARNKRGSIDFDIPEPKIELDKAGHPRSIRPRGRGISERIIEEFMLMANETVAKTYFFRDIPFIYRSHPQPEPVKIQELANVCGLFGISLKGKGKTIHPKLIRSVIEKAGDCEGSRLISVCALRSMQQARYSGLDHEHFGLALKYYCHFTSPIRRYPDLFIHRIIKEDMKKPIAGKRLANYEKLVPKVAKRSSDMERRAIECEREVDKLKMCQYMEDFIGESFKGFISGVTASGIYVQLDNTVEGMIPIGNLGNDHYVYREQEYAVVGKNFGECFRMGDRIEVRVERVDTGLKIIDFGINKNGKNKRKNNRNK